MRFTTLSNYHLIDWWCDAEFLFVYVWFGSSFFFFCYSNLRRETGGFDFLTFFSIITPISGITDHYCIVENLKKWKETRTNQEQDTLKMILLMILVILIRKGCMWPCKSNCPHALYRIFTRLILKTSLNKNSITVIFRWILQNILEYLFYRTSRRNCWWPCKHSSSSVK